MYPSISEIYINLHGKFKNFIGNETDFIKYICLESNFEEFSDFLDLAISHFRSPNNTVADVVNEETAVLLSKRIFKELKKLSEESDDEDTIAIKHTLIFAINYFDRREIFPILFKLYQAEANKRCKTELFNRLVSCANSDNKETEAEFIEELKNIVENDLKDIEKVGYALLKLKNYDATSRLLAKITDSERYSIAAKLKFYQAGIYNSCNLPLKDYLIQTIPKLSKSETDKSSKNKINTLNIIYKSTFHKNELIKEVEQLKGNEQKLLILKIYDLMTRTDLTELKNTVYLCIHKNILHTISKIELFQEIKLKKLPKKEYETWLSEIINWMKLDLTSGKLIFAYKKHTEKFLPESDITLQDITDNTEEEFISNDTWEDRWRKELKMM